MKFINFDVSVGDGKIIQLKSQFPDAAGKIRSAIESDQSGAVFGDTWRLAVEFVLAGADWPAWTRYHAHLRSMYQIMLHDEPEYRCASWNSEQSRKDIMWKRVELAQSLSKNNYLPEGVRLPQFIEGSPARPSWLRSTAERRDLHPNFLREWFLRSFSSQQITRGPNSDFSPSTWKSLCDCGLVVKNEEVPPALAVRVLSLAELRDLLRKIGAGPVNSLNAAHQLFTEFAELEPDMAVRMSNDAIGRSGVYMQLPPKGETWDDFQSWRQQIRGMGVAVTDLYSGQVDVNFARLSV